MSLARTLSSLTGPVAATSPVNKEAGVVLGTISSASSASGLLGRLTPQEGVLLNAVPEPKGTPQVVVLGSVFIGPTAATGGTVVGATAAGV